MQPPPLTVNGLLALYIEGNAEDKKRSPRRSERLLRHIDQD